MGALIDGSSDNEDQEATEEEHQMKQQLAQLSEDLEVEDYTMIAESSTNEDDLTDNTDGLVDENELLNTDERKDLQNTIWPVQLALVKLCKLGYKIIHSTTKILPTWHDILCELKMTPSILPCDVSTWWNSTFDMLQYALKHQDAIDAVTQHRDLGLRAFEMTDNEWRIVEQLCNVLKVRFVHVCLFTANVVCK
ncbi:hypothetical protein DFH29DRAFT_813631 [Suillus ampliporus]|nr:hypothetical protein DFH29DRAFT_813631 [Suillus ampliporus]